MNRINRRDFVKGLVGTAAVLGLSAPLGPRADAKLLGMRLGLVTYLWGKDMDLPTLIRTCEQSGLLGVELRTEHAHGVEPALSRGEREEVKKRFADSPVELVGYGSNAQFHDRDASRVSQNVELTKRYIHLMHDCGGSGVKVKPNYVPKGDSREESIERIGRALSVVGAYGADYGQEIRVEVHGRGSSELPVIKAIVDVAGHPNVRVCWNSNDEDLVGEGLGYNFNLVKDQFGGTVHVREMNLGNYPYERLMKLFVESEYAGWILLEARTDPKDKVQAMIEQRRIFERMIGEAD